jgi:hypothetical protein
MPEPQELTLDRGHIRSSGVVAVAEFLAGEDPAGLSQTFVFAARLAKNTGSRRALERAARAAVTETTAGRPPVWSNDSNLREAREIIAQGLEPTWNRALRRVAKKYSSDPRTIRSIAERLRRYAKMLERDI